MRRLLTSALTVLATAALPACANAQFLEGTPKVAGSSEPNIQSAVSEIQTDIQSRIDSTRAQAQDLVSSVAPQDEPQNEAAPAPDPQAGTRANAMALHPHQGSSAGSTPRLAP